MFCGESIEQGYEGKCSTGQNYCSEPRGYATDGGKVSEIYFATKKVSKQVNKCEKVVDKVHSILKSINISMSHYDSEIDDLQYIISIFSDSLKRTRLSNSNHNYQHNNVIFKSEDIRLIIEALELELTK